jgi:hypothetical protein
MKPHRPFVVFNHYRFPPMMARVRAIHPTIPAARLDGSTSFMLVVMLVLGTMSEESSSVAHQHRAIPHHLIHGRSSTGTQIREYPADISSCSRQIRWTRCTIGARPRINKISLASKMCRSRHPWAIVPFPAEGTSPCSHFRRARAAIGPRSRDRGSSTMQK